MLPRDVNQYVQGTVIRVASEPKVAPKGGYLFRGLEIATDVENCRVFILFPEYAGKDIYEFPLLCWEGSSVRGYHLELNNTLKDGSVIYAATPESDLLLEPHRPVSVTEAVEAADCLKSADVRVRTGTGEPFWMAKGRLIHEFLDHLLHSCDNWNMNSFPEAYRKALPALKEILPGSTVSVNEKNLKQDAETHFRNLVTWLSDHRESFSTAEIEADRISCRWGIKGRADAILRGNGRPLILELKSGKVPVDAHLYQLYAYSLLFSSDGDQPLANGQVFYSGTSRTRTVDHATSNDIKSLVLNGRNRVVALRHSYTASNSSNDTTHEDLACSRKGKCFSRKDCYLLFGSPSGGASVLSGREREYYDRWFRLISLDIWETEGEFSKVLDSSTLSERIEEGTTISLEQLAIPDTSTEEPADAHLHGMRPASEQREGRSPAFPISHIPKGTAVARGRLSQPSGSSDISFGQEFIVHRGDLCSSEAFRARVVGNEDDHVFLRFKIPLSTVEPVASSEGFSSVPPEGWFLDRIPFSRPREVSRQSLFDFFTRAHRDVVNAVIRGDDPSLPSDDDLLKGLTGHPDEVVDAARSSAQASDLDDLCFSEGLLAELNEDQEAAIRSALACDTYHLIHGPPGTGKTRLLARLIRLCLDRGERVLVACPTNVALDGLLISCMDLGVTEFLRVGRRSSVSGRFLDALERLGSPPTLLHDLAASDMDLAAFRKRVKNTRLVGATAYQCAGHPIFLRQRFDRVIIDEAGQLDEPSTLAPLSLARRFVLGGDHLQLPPIVQTIASNNRSEEGPGLEQSLFERLVLTAPDRRISRLRMQYRMNQEVQDIPSRLFYDGALFPSPEAKVRKLSIERGVSSDSEVNEILNPQLPVLFVDVEGPSSGQARPEEADVACRIVEGLLTGGVPSHEVGIITPYRAQQALIRKRLEQGNGTSALSVDTVDRFQGGEREVIILSLSRSDGVTSFLADSKRLNVSLSRARSKLILLGNGRVLEEHPLFASILEGLERVRVCPDCG
jgi:DNA replication ATP-dependent helicase Dna2